jgi:hypothetical protein
MHFEYQVSIDEYASASLLYWELTSGRSRIERALFWIAAGAALVVIAWTESPLLRSIVMTAVGALWIYEGGLRNLVPESYLYRNYSGERLHGRTFRAEINEEAFEVTTGSWNWRVPREGIRLRAEDERVFLAYSFGTMFIFGKKYLTPEQQQDIRRLLGTNSKATSSIHTSS